MEEQEKKIWTPMKWMDGWMDGWMAETAFSSIKRTYGE
jgi:hypothetical protein